MNQAVVDQMGKVRAAKKALDDAARAAYTGGPGSPEAKAANDRLPELKKNYADALNDLGKLPNYGDIDPSALRASADGHFLFGYDADGQPVQVTGQLKNGTGEIFDQGRGTYYTFKDGKLVGMRTPDPGRVEATDEPLFSAVTLAVGGPEIKAGGEAAIQGFKSLLERRAVGLGADITSENVIAQTLSAAEVRAKIAEQELGATAAEHAPASLPPGAIVDHPPPVTTEHPGPVPDHEPTVVGGGAHVPVEPLPEVPQPLPHDSPLFEGYHPVEPGPEFTNPDGSLVYPNDSLPGHVYAIPGTVADARLPAGTVIDRFGYPGRLARCRRSSLRRKGTSAGQRVQTVLPLRCGRSHRTSTGVEDRTIASRALVQPARRWNAVSDHRRIRRNGQRDRTCKIGIPEKDWLMTDFTRLAENWYRWAPGLGGGDVTVSSDDSETVFSSEDYKVHLHRDESWWVVDTVNDRGQRRDGAAKLSNFDLTEKYLIWDWATTVRSSLASGAMGADLAKLGYAPGVEVSQADRGWRICANTDCAILSVVDATIFSHLMTKSVDEIERLTRIGLGPAQSLNPRHRSR